MFNLRTLNEPEMTPATIDASEISNFSGLNFTVPSAFLGNIGEPLNFDYWEHHTGEYDSYAAGYADRKDENARLTHGGLTGEQA